MNASSPRVTRCRYLVRVQHKNDRPTLDQCTAQAVDEHGEILLCHKHLGRALELLNHAIRKQTP